MKRRGAFLIVSVSLALVLAVALQLRTEQHGPIKEASKDVAARHISGPRVFAIPITASATGTLQTKSTGAAEFAQELSRLMDRGRRGDAEAAWTAYEMAAVCHKARGLQRLLPQFENSAEAQAVRRSAEVGNTRNLELCSNVIERDIDLASRLQMLDIAIKAGDNRARVAFYAEGPNGDPRALNDRSDDPLVKEWKAQAAAYLDAAAKTGDFEGSFFAALVFDGGDFVPADLPRSLAYLKVALQVYADRNGKPLDDAAKWAEWKASQLSAEELSRADALATQILAACCLKQN